MTVVVSLTAYMNVNMGVIKLNIMCGISILQHLSSKNAARVEDLKLHKSM